MWYVMDTDTDEAIGPAYATRDEAMDARQVLIDVSDDPMEAMVGLVVAEGNE